MHSVAFAITEHITVGTYSFAHPFAVAVWLKFIAPDIPKIVFIDIALMIVAAYACASRY
jgi:hypothetical protein